MLLLVAARAVLARDRLAALVALALHVLLELALEIVAAKHGRQHRAEAKTFVLPADALLAELLLLLDQARHADADFVSRVDGHQVLAGSQRHRAPASLDRDLGLLGRRGDHAFGVRRADRRTLDLGGGLLDLGRCERAAIAPISLQSRAKRDEAVLGLAEGAHEDADRQADAAERRGENDQGGDDGLHAVGQRREAGRQPLMASVAALKPSIATSVNAPPNCSFSSFQAFDSSRTALS